MSRVLMLVEGQTERAIVQQVFAPELALKGIDIYPRVVGGPRHRGGNKFSVVRRDIINLIRQEPHSYVTMLFDYYGLPSNWPMLDEAHKLRSGEAANVLEKAIVDSIAKEIGDDFNPDKFIAYVQLHEIESLLFAGPNEMAKVFGKTDLAQKVKQIVDSCGGCEQINNEPETSPSRRIQTLFPNYKKGSSVSAHAHQIAKKIGLDRIRKECPHFNGWLTRLENLPQRATNA